jgi:hypothetical protein
VGGVLAKMIRYHGDKRNENVLFERNGEGRGIQNSRADWTVDFEERFNDSI